MMEVGVDDTVFRCFIACFTCHQAPLMNLETNRLSAGLFSEFCPCQQTQYFCRCDFHSSALIDKSHLEAICREECWTWPEPVSSSSWEKMQAAWIERRFESDIKVGR